MGQKIYGVDLEELITPVMVRDAMVRCFYEAHCAQAGLGLKKEVFVDKSYCQEIVRKAFSDAGEDFDKPSKESILKALNNLKTFSASFREPNIIEKHYNEIMRLVERLD